MYLEQKLNAHQAAAGFIPAEPRLEANTCPAEASRHRGACARGGAVLVAFGLAVSHRPAGMNPAVAQEILLFSAYYPVMAWFA